jgi:hypothetical protein
MSIDDLVERLRQIAAPPTDPEAAHAAAEDALLDYIADDAVRAAFEAVPKWYA